MTDSKPERPIVRRGVFALTRARQRQVLEVLSYIELRHEWIDPDMFRIDMTLVAALQRIFGAGEDDAPPSISVTYDEVFALETFVMAADTYAHRKGERKYCEVTDAEFDDLDLWVAQTRRWFVTPLRDT